MADSGTKEDIDSFSYDEAVDLTGHGWYNRWLLFASSVISIAVALDMFGFTIVVAAASCDLELGLKETGLLASAPFVGIVFAFPWGYFADTRGRRLALLLSSSGGCLLATLTALSPSWEAMMVLKMLSCSFSAVSYTLTMTYVGESVSSKHRAKYLFVLTGINLLSEFVSFVIYVFCMLVAANSIATTLKNQKKIRSNCLSQQINQALAYLLLSLDFRIPMTWLSIVFRPWRLFTIVMALPLGLGAVMLLFLQESPKFLADKGETANALQVLRIMFKTNGGRRADYPVKRLKTTTSPPSSTFWRSIVDQTVPLSKPPLLKTTVMLYYLMMICSSTSRTLPVLPEPYISQSSQRRPLQPVISETIESSIVDQTVPLSKPPLLKITVMLYYLMMICSSTNNVFLMWYPMIVNMFFNALSEGSNAGSFCESISYNPSNATIVQDLTCDDTISPNTLYSGMIYGIFFCALTLVVAQVANHRRLVLISTYVISAASGVLLNVVGNPVAVMIFFTLLQGTTIGIGSVASYFTDLYPTSYRGLATSLSMMFARFTSMGGVNLVGATIFSYCDATFYCWSAFVISGAVVTLFLPRNNKE